jgi:hypothetical protein
MNLQILLAITFVFGVLKLLTQTKIFDAKIVYIFDVILPHKGWEKSPTTKFIGTGETYVYSDEKFCLGGSAYSAPCLYAL